MTNKDESCPSCGADLEDTDRVLGKCSAKDGDYWCSYCEVGYEDNELNDVKVDKEPKDETTIEFTSDDFDWYKF